MIDQRIDNSLLNAAYMRARAERESAIAELLVYLRNPAAIGDHPGFLSEIDKLVEAASSAEERIKFLDNLFKAGEPTLKEDAGTET